MVKKESTIMALSFGWKRNMEYNHMFQLNSRWLLVREDNPNLACVSNFHQALAEPHESRTHKK